nr:helicase-related protein [Pleurocapsa sp. FMAR1]
MAKKPTSSYLWHYWMARFEGKFRDGVHTVDTSDLMRRLVKEDLLKFDGKPLFPERRAYTVEYHLSDLEAKLYSAVTEYVREEFNRADALSNNGRKGTVGFALTILQRRLASSPEAIYQSLKRRHERLQKRLKEEELVKRGQEVELDWQNLPGVKEEDWSDFEDDLFNDERETTEEELVDRATAARTIAELKVEIELLQKLEKIALQVKLSGMDRKWEELSRILQNEAELFDVRGHRRKLVIFTEHRDTLNYLAARIRNLIGKQETVVTISGGSGREERRKAQEAFTQDPDIQVLIATDAAGEGINLQRAHLMVNYDLPWNPNRLEQRFGRIHRIGQTEVCHLWNLLAAETREGDVYLKLLKKLEVEQKALGGKVFDVLGQAIDGVELRQLLIEAIRYGDLPETRAKLEQIVTNRLNRDRLQDLLSEKVLARNAMDITKIQRIREEIERAEARKLQPHFIGSFFIEAFQHLGGVIRQREPKRYQITNVPAIIRNRGRQIGTREPILTCYERICFDKELISVLGKPLAAFICPGHPLLDATIDLVSERHRDVLKRGSILIDENDPSEEVRILITLQHSIQDAKTDLSGKRRIVSRRMQYVEIILDDLMSSTDDKETTIRNAGYAPYLDYRPLLEDEQTVIETFLEESNLPTDIEAEATKYAISQIVPQHLQEVKQHKEELIDKTLVAVKDRLTKEINYWDYRAAELKYQEEAGKTNAKINSAKARVRADELQARLARRIYELNQERRLSPLPPVVVGGALVIPMGLLHKLQGKSQPKAQMFAKETKRVEMFAMNAVIAAEKKLGYEPKDVSSLKCGYDIESRISETEALRFIEVKGRIEGAETVTVTKNEIITALNKPENYILAVVEVSSSEEFTEGDASNVYYLRQPFQKEPDFGVTSVNYNLKELKERSQKPC